MKTIELSEDGGSLFGYVVDASEVNLANYFDDHIDYASQVMDLLRERREVVALLRNLAVDEDCRGQGIGSALVSRFLEEAEKAGATAFILISDENESQADGFVLAEWYESFGFERALASNEGPIMVIPECLADALRQLQVSSVESCLYSGPSMRMG